LSTVVFHPRLDRSDHDAGLRGRGGIGHADGSVEPVAVLHHEMRWEVELLPLEFGLLLA